jgi:hypothetical protein
MERAHDREDPAFVRQRFAHELAGAQKSQALDQRVLELPGDDADAAAQAVVVGFQPAAVPKHDVAPVEIEGRGIEATHDHALGLGSHADRGALRDHVQRVLNVGGVALEIGAVGEAEAGGAQPGGALLGGDLGIRLEPDGSDPDRHLVVQEAVDAADEREHRQHGRHAQEDAGHGQQRPQPVRAHLGHGHDEADTSGLQHAEHGPGTMRAEGAAGQRPLPERVGRAQRLVRHAEPPPAACGLRRGRAAGRSACRRTTQT